MSDVQGIRLGRSDGGVEVITPVGTALSGAPTLTGAVNTCTAASGNTAVALPQNASAAVVVNNTAATSVALLVYPPTSAGKINSGSAGASLSVAQNLTAVFYPLANGIDYVAILTA